MFTHRLNRNPRQSSLHPDVIIFRGIMCRRCCFSLCASANAMSEYTLIDIATSFTSILRIDKYRERQKRRAGRSHLARLFSGNRKNCVAVYPVHHQPPLLKATEAWPCREKDLSSGGWFGNKSHRCATRIVSKRHWWIRNAMDAFQTEDALINSHSMHLSRNTLWKNLKNNLKTTSYILI